MVIFCILTIDLNSCPLGGPLSFSNFQKSFPLLYISIIFSLTPLYLYQLQIVQFSEGEKKRKD